MERKHGLTLAVLAIGIILFFVHLGIFVFIYLPTCFILALILVIRSRRTKQRIKVGLEEPKPEAKIRVAKVPKHPKVIKMSRKKLFCLILAIAIASGAVVAIFIKPSRPPAHVRIPGTGEMELKHDSGGSPGGSGGYPGCWDWGPLVEFTPPVMPFLVDTVKIAACLREYTEGDTFIIEVWDENLTVLESSVHPLNTFPDFPNIDWREIDIDDVEVQGKFYVLVWFGENYEKMCVPSRDECVPYSNAGKPGGIMQDREKYMHPEHGFPAGWLIRVIGRRAPNVFITLVDTDNNPIPGVEVELWKTVNDTIYQTGSTRTNSEGVAALYAPPDTYEIVINLATLPKGYPCPQKTPITIMEEGMTQKTLVLTKSGEDT